MRTETWCVVAILVVSVLAFGCGDDSNGSGGNSDTDTDTDTDTDSDSDSDTDTDSDSDSDTDTDSDSDSDTDTDCTDFPGEPNSPSPAHNALNVLPETVTTLDWADASGATSYDVYWGETCPPPAYPDAAFTDAPTSELTGVVLEFGTAYCWQVVAIDDDGCFSEGSIWTFETISNTAGTTCADAVDLSAAEFPFQLSGTFDDDPTSAGCCDSTPANVVWFKYTPANDGLFTIDAVNNSTTVSHSRLAVLVGDTCDPLGTDVNCEAVIYNAISAWVDLTGGQTYLIAFYTDSEEQTMVDPEITITEVVPDQGMVCEEAIDVSVEAFPYPLTGTFDVDWGPLWSCDNPIYNLFWFTYMPTADALYEIEVTNNTTDDVDSTSGLAVFSGSACDPLGTELAHVGGSSEAVAASAELTGGTTYTVAYYTGRNEYSTVDPEIWIGEAVIAPGEVCDAAADISSETFPFELTGTFESDVGPADSCDSVQNNVVWFTYTPASSGFYQIQFENTSDFSPTYTRLAIFSDNTCDPLGTEIACLMAESNTITTTKYLQGSVPHLIVAYTQGDDVPMVDPTISISPHTAEPGEFCQAVVNVSAETFPYQLTGVYDDDPTATGSCSESSWNAVWFSYQPTASGSYNIELQNNTTGHSWSVLAVFEGASCSPLGTEIACATNEDEIVSATADLAADTPYLILFHVPFEDTTEGDNLMVSPSINITAL